MSENQGAEPYDDVLVAITTYVFHHEVHSALAWERSRLALLDALGCAIESLQTSPECASIIGPVVPGTVVPNGFRLPGTAHRLDPVKGAFDLGTLIRYLDHNDAFPGAEWGHPSDNIGAILAVADWLCRSTTIGQVPGASISADEAQVLPPLTLRTILIALIKAYEIQGCLQELNSFNAVGLDHTILVKVASTAVVSWLLGLSEPQTHAALSQVFQDGHALRTFRQAPNASPRKGWAAGDACMRAVQLALLTRDGQPGAPTVLTNPKWGFYNRLFRGKQFELRRPYSSWVIERVGFKLIPAEGHAISAVEAALKVVEMMSARNLSVQQDVEAIKIRTQGPAFTIINKPGILRNAADRDHCLQYIVAVVLLKGSVIDTFDYMDTSPWATNPQVDQLRAKIEVIKDPQFTKDYYDPAKRSCSNAIQIILNGAVSMEEVVVEYPIGNSDRVDTVVQLKVKIRKNLRLAFGNDRVDEILKAVEQDEIAVGEFVDLFARA